MKYTTNIERGEICVGAISGDVLTEQFSNTKNNAAMYLFKFEAIVDGEIQISNPVTNDITSIDYQHVRKIKPINGGDELAVTTFDRFDPMEMANRIVEKDNVIGYIESNGDMVEITVHSFTITSDTGFVVNIRSGDAGTSIKFDELYEKKKVVVFK